MINPWYVILKSRYDAKAINETYVLSFVTKGKITQTEYNEIIGVT